MRKYYLVIIGICLTMFVQAQIPKIVNVDTAGGLSAKLTPTEKANINYLTITGNIDSRDFDSIYKTMPLLMVVDMSAVTIKAYKNDKANAIPNNVNYIRGVIKNIKTFIFPSNLESIGKAAFLSCAKLTSIVIPQTVDSIGESAFNGCIALRNILIPSTVSSIGKGAFAHTDTITVDAGNTRYVSIAGVLYTKNQDTLLHCPSSIQGAFTIPSSVIRIDNSAFNDCKGLTAITIPTSVKTIGSNAFHLCVQLTSIQIPTSVTSIEDGAFAYCSALNSISLPPTISKIERATFYNCSALSSIVIPNSVDSIGMYAFFKCTNLTTVTLSKALIKLDWFSFEGCTNLISISLPSTLTSIDGYIFDGCRKLQTLIIPTSVTSINESAFYHCTALKSITIPSSVTFLGNGAFTDCSSLRQLYSLSRTPIDLSKGGDVFDRIDTNLCTLYVPFGSKTAYQNANQWSAFVHIEELSGFWLSDSTISLLDIANNRKAVYVSTTGNWSATTNVPWLSISPSSGTGNDSIIISAQPNMGSERSATVTVSSTESIELKALEEKTITVFQDAYQTGTKAISNYYSISPNPANNYFTINTKEDISVQLFSVNGSQVLNRKISDNEKIPINNLSAGIYYIKLITKDGVKYQTLIKE